MKKGFEGKFWAVTAAAAGAAAAGLAVRKIRNSHHQLVSSSGEALLEETAARQQNKKVWDHYPRPQMRRDSFYNLNGSWELNGRKVLAPFPPQSILAGYGGKVGTDLTYSREFTLPGEWKGGRILLHFGAVDQVAEVFLNGHSLGKHEGGYLPFHFDVTECVSERTNRIDVKVKDTLSVQYPYGKQRKARGGMWYTPVSGIWQSVWMECVPQIYIAGLKITADTEKVRISVKRGGEDCCKAKAGAGCNVKAGTDSKGAVKSQKDCAIAGTMDKKGTADGQGSKAEDGMAVTITLHDGTRYTMQAAGTEEEIDMTKIKLADGSHYQPVLWNTEHPYLYEISVTMGEDTVASYFGLRTIEVKKVDGIPRVCLNGEPIFLQGVLDQGYFCDGIYLPAKEEEYEQDVLRMKALGMNLLRKHIKIEPEAFYYYCDVHGMLVMQDMVNNGFYSWIRDTALPTLGFCRKKDEKSWHGKKRRDFFVQHMKETIHHLHNHPCIVAYTIFNEGWGQFESDAMYSLAKSLDSTRLYDATSGWFSQTESDFDSQHIYFKKLEIPEKPEKPVLVSECGGYSLRVPGHFYAKYARYGYGECKNRTELTDRVKKLYEETILPAIPKGLCGCIYTQLSDVEDEVNGFYTYDRKVCKVEPEVMTEVAERLEEAISV